MDEPPPPLAAVVFVALNGRFAGDDIGLDSLLGQVDGDCLFLVDRDSLPTTEPAGETARIRRDSSPAPWLVCFVYSLFWHPHILKWDLSECTC